jgi:hypothetical protein
MERMGHRIDCLRTKELSDVFENPVVREALKWKLGCFCGVVGIFMIARNWGNGTIDGDGVILRPLLDRQN